MIFRDSIPAPAPRCPFFDARNNRCAASFSGDALLPKQRCAYCLNEDYDACALFLARQLRCSQAIEAGSSSMEFCSK